jgi:hypothetical protein
MANVVHNLIHVGAPTSHKLMGLLGLLHGQLYLLLYNRMGNSPHIQTHVI